MLTKSIVQSQIENLPDEFSIDDLIDRLIFIEKVNQGNKQSEAGIVLSEEELDKEIAKWFR